MNIITYELHMRSSLHLSFQSTCSYTGVFAQQTVCNSRLDRNLASCRPTWPAGWVLLSLWEQRPNAVNTHSVQTLWFLYVCIIVRLPSYERCGHRCPVDILRFKHRVLLMWCQPLHMCLRKRDLVGIPHSTKCWSSKKAHSKEPDSVKDSERFHSNDDTVISESFWMIQ